MNINVEYKNEQGKFPIFLEKVKDKKVAVMFDVNTKPFAKYIINDLKNVVEISFLDEELIPDENKCQFALELTRGCDYLLAVGSGTLNDMAKDISTKLNIECGVLATAPSMDGYCSKGSALMVKGKKITNTVHTPSDVLIDADIIKSAPKLMIASGFGDIMGKFTCILDWQLSHYKNGESINQKAYDMMVEARKECMDNFNGIANYEGEAVEKLMNALIVAGLSMAESGDSRPASGSEHHMSHFLEMDFVARGERVPLHGVKVGIGTLVSIEIYNYLKDNDVKFKGSDEVYKLVEKLPCVCEIKEKLEKLGCPIKFSQIGVRKETMEEMIEKAYTVRDRYTVLTLVNELGLTEKIKPIIMAKYY